MEILNAIIITIISVFCLQAFLLTLLLLLKKENRQANRLLALVLLFFGLAALNVALFYFLVLFDNTELIPYLKLELLFGLGPSLYLYTKSVTDPNYKIYKWEYLHFLAVFFEFIYYRTSWYKAGILGILETPQNWYNYIFLAVQWIGITVTSVYITLSILLLFGYRKWIKNNYSNLDQKKLSWFTKPVISYALFWFLWIFIRLVDVFIYSENYRSVYFYSMFIILSLITCWIGFQGYIRSRVAIVGFSKKEKTKQKTSTSYAKIAIELKRIMEKKRLYLDPDLSMKSFSEQTEFSTKQISRAINMELNLNFHQFINEYRVDEFKKRIQNDQKSNLTLLGHAYESGFASKSTFNHIFKKYTKVTPKQYYQYIHNEKK